MGIDPKIKWASEKRSISDLVPAEYKINLAYFAGLIDGEGSIGFKRTRDKRPNRTAISYSPLFQITNCDLEMLRWVAEFLDKLGIKYAYWLRKMSQRKSHWRDAGNISVQAIDDVYRLLKLLLPYLKSKKANAEILFAFCKYKMAQRRRNGKGQYRHTFRPIEELYWNKLHSLNHKGLRNYEQNRISEEN